MQHASALVTTRTPGCFDYGHSRRLLSPPNARPPPPPPPIPAGRTEGGKELEHACQLNLKWVSREKVLATEATEFGKCRGAWTPASMEERILYPSGRERREGEASIQGMLCGHRHVRDVFLV